MHASYGMGSNLVVRSLLADAHKLVAVDPALREVVEYELQRLMNKTRAVFNENNRAIRRIAEALVARRTLSGEEVELLLNDEVQGGLAAGLTAPRAVTREP